MENNFWLIGIIGKILGILEKSYAPRSFKVSNNSFLRYLIFFSPLFDYGNDIYICIYIYIYINRKTEINLTIEVNGERVN